MPIWNERCETMQRADLEQLQLERLQATVNRVYRNVPFYQRRFEELSVKPEEIRSLDDIRRLPFTTKEDMRAAYPYELFAVPLREIVRIHSSSGTTGRATVVGYTRNDLRTWSELVARIISAVGVTDQDVVQITFGYGLFTGGFGLHYGAERVGASVIPVSSGNTERQIQIMRDFRTTALVGTPSYALHIAEVMKERGIDRSSLCLRVGLFGGEPSSEQMRKKLEESLDIMATDNYGLSEVLGPGVAGECECQCGMHINEDHFIAEVIDPQTLEPVPYGQEGELVLTTLTKEGIPVIRYRTRDLTSLNPEPCRCGRTNVRMKKVLSRTDDMLIVRGVNVYPSQIEQVLFEVEGVEPHYQIVLERRAALDEMTILVEVSRELFTGQMSRLVELETKIRSRMHSVIGITPRLKLVEPRSLERSLGKARRVVDNRKI
ncbi:MAG TPA: phenylacetate--CoA ligase [Armatimonadota bacterium]|nr:phenylacetate--CoA ligase [Armatimonadota bacterium]